MDVQKEKDNIVKELQREVLSLQRYGQPSLQNRIDTGLGVIESAFPGGVFPTGAMHEFISYSSCSAAATNGFMAGIGSSLMAHGGACVWVGARNTVFPAALNAFGIMPERVVFIDPLRQKEVLWTIEEALKCDALSLVVGELGELSFTESRRLQLAVEHSRVTGFIHRRNPRSENTVACVSRWKITPVASVFSGAMPGVGMPRWQVQLLKVRNGIPGNWTVEWANCAFRYIPHAPFAISGRQTRKAG